MFGNKVDRIDDRQVQQDQVTDWLKENQDVIYFETSAFDGSNVQEAFSKIASNFL